MKTTRRIITLALAALLILGLVIPALAATETGGTITIEGTTETIYTVYKMLTVEDGNDAEENKYKVDSDWAAFVTQSSMEPYFEVKETNDGSYVLWVKDTTSSADAAAIAELARAYVEDPANATVATNTKIGEVTVNDVALPVAANGYYLLVPNNDTASGVIVVKNGEDKEIVEKSVAPGMPTIVKQVYEDSIQGYATSNTVDVGVPFTYKVTITAGQGASNYILHDCMDEHIIYANDINITRGGNTVLPEEYEVQTGADVTDGCTFHIKFDEAWCKGLNEGAVIVVTYKGILQGEQVGDEYTEVDTDTAHENTAWLTHTSQNVNTDKSTVATRTFEINVVKQDQDGDPLAGAGFILRDNENNYYHYENGVVSWGTKENATEYTSDENGKLRFYGVDAEIFYLEEKTVPGGYTGVSETQVNAKNGNVKDGDVIVVNHLGEALPETGGIGTTVFYVLGGVLLIGALVVLATMKRKETSAQ